MPRDHTDGVERGCERHGACAADAAPGRLDGGDAAGGRGQAQRSAGIGAEPRRNGAIGHRAGRSRRRAAGDTRWVPGVAGVTDDVIMPHRPEREFGQVQGTDLQCAQDVIRMLLKRSVLMRSMS